MKRINYISLILVFFSCSYSSKNNLTQDIYTSNNRVIKTIGLQADFQKQLLKKEFYKAPYFIKQYFEYSNRIDSSIDLLLEKTDSYIEIITFDKRKELGISRDVFQLKEDKINSLIIETGVDYLVANYDSSLIENDSLILNLFKLEAISKRLNNSKSLENLIYLQIIQKRLLIFKSRYLEDIASQFSKDEIYPSEYRALVSISNPVYNKGEEVLVQIVPVKCLKIPGLQFKIEGVNDLEIDSLGNFKFKPNQKGLQENNFEIIKPNPKTGDSATYSSSLRYYVY
jgi:hypothetical protein